MSADTQSTVRRDEAATPPPATPEPPRSSGQAVWPIVMVREIVVKLRDKNFVIGTLITLALIGGALVLQVVIGSKGSDVAASVTGDGARQVMQQVGQAAEQRGENTRVTVVDAADPAAVEAAVRSGTADLGLVHTGDGWRLLGKTDISSSVSADVTDVVRQQTLEANAAKEGTTVAALTAGGTVTSQLLEPDSNEGLKRVVGLIFTFLFYFASITFGMTIAQSVVEEKQSRVVEILVSAVPLRQLLAGKVLGNVLLALAQMVLYVGVGLVGLAFTSYAAQIGLIASSAVWFLVFFVAGFAALACLWAVAGSLATRNEDLQSTTPVLTTLLVVVMFVGLLGEGTVRLFGSYVPVLSAISMPQRLLAGEAQWWEPFLSLVVTLAFAAWTMVVGEKLYKRSILNTGRRLGVREALRAEA